MPKKHLAIIGNGMAATRLLDELLKRHAGARYNIDVYGDEPGTSYNRILLGKVLCGDDPDHIRMRATDWSAPAGAEVRFFERTRIQRLDSATRKLFAIDGRSFHYDVAVLATGSRPFIPKIEGAMTAGGAIKPGVFAFRTLDDCLQIRSKIRPGDNAVVLGGGLLGLECARRLRDCGLHVTVVHLAQTLMETQLDAHAGRMLQRQIEANGLFVRCGVTVAGVQGEEQVESIKLSDGTVLAADLLVVSCGIRPNVDVASASGIPVNRGIMVNDSLATTVPGVYAVGECAEHRGTVYGIVAPIWDQCGVLADVLSGADPTRRYEGSKLYTRLKVAGVEVCSMGQIEPSLETDRVVQVMEERRSTYQKLIVRGQKVIGAQLVGDTDAAGTLVQTFDAGTAVVGHPLALLCNGGPREAQTEMVCACHRVSKTAIVDAIRQGCESVDAVGEATRAGTGCGSCKVKIQALLRTTSAVSMAS
ncbi:MAG: FAD-dependent oxidoreductase [Tepidisphaeraceae bacterium]